MTLGRPYVGRFAPSPTGRLHLGSMVAAVASYLDARAHGGTWLVRIEDLDPPREVEGAADDILRTLEGYGLHWDGSVMYQHQRGDAYLEALEFLQSQNSAFGCNCSRKELQEVDGLSLYPGTCRDGLPPGLTPRSWRFRMAEEVDLKWEDRLQGQQSFRSTEIGDFTLRRGDGYWAYHLAVVVDDDFQGVTDVVRGSDLLESTAAHLALQRALQFPTPRYAHVPVVTNEAGQKLSKQTLADAVQIEDASKVLLAVLKHLNVNGVHVDEPERMLREAVTSWGSAMKQ